MLKQLNEIRISSAQIERVLFYFVTFSVFIILCTSYFLPMSDLPQHAGQIQALKAIITGQADAPWFNDVELNYMTPYWIGYSLGLALSFFVPINYAVNIEVGLAFLLFVLAFSVLRKRFNGPAVLDWILLPSFFSAVYAVGLLTFLLAIPIGVFLLIQNLNWLERGGEKYGLSVLFIGILLYFSHMLIFLFFCTIAGAMILVDAQYSLKNRLKKLWPFFVLLLFVPLFLFSTEFFAPSELDLHYSRDSSQIVFNSNGYLARLVGLFYQSIPMYLFGGLRGVSEHVYLGITGLLVLMTILFPWLVGGCLTKDLKRYVPLCAVLVAVLCFPSYMGKTAFIYERFTIFLLPFFILIFEKKVGSQLFEKAGRYALFSFLFVFISLSLVVSSISAIHKYNQIEEDFKILLEKLPEKKRVLSLIYPVLLTSVKVHQISWYQALKNGWNDFNFAWFPPQVIRFKADKVPEARPDFEWRPTDFVSFKNCDKYDLLIVNLAQPEQLKDHDVLMKQSTCSHQLKYQQGLWFVYSKE